MSDIVKILIWVNLEQVIYNAEVIYSVLKLFIVSILINLNSELVYL